MTRLHLLRCRDCRTYSSQLHQIGELVRGYYPAALEDDLQRVEREIIDALAPPRHAGDQVRMD